MPAFTISCLLTLFWDTLGLVPTAPHLAELVRLTYTTNRQLVMGIRKEIASRNAAVSVEGFTRIHRFPCRCQHRPRTGQFGRGL